MRPAVLLWDFGDTLADERWMRRAPSEFPEWERAWADVMAALASRWDVGTASEHDVVAALVERTGLTASALERHFDECCRSIELHPVAWRVAREHRRPQALVTVNPDLFVTRVAPTLGIDAMFDAVVVSGVEGVADKVRLCEVALERLGYDGDRGEVLLIDNRPDLVDAWRATGGAGYVYEGDEAFAAALDGLIP